MLLPVLLLLLSVLLLLLSLLLLLLIFHIVVKEQGVSTEGRAVPFAVAVRA